MFTRKKFNKYIMMAIMVYAILLPAFLQSCSLFKNSKGIIPNIKNENIDINLVLIGFDSEYILEDFLDSLLPTEIDPFLHSEANMSFPHSNYELNYTISHLPEEDVTALEEYIDDIAEFDSLLGYRVNQTFLDDYLINPVFNDIMDFFIPCSGYTIDAGLTEDYFYNNIHSDFEDTSHYTLYLMNFSFIDSEDHSVEHSFVPSYVDCDSNRSTDISVAGTDQRNTVGWGGNYRFCYADLSALSEYLFQYTFMLGADLTTAPDYYRYDLDTFTDLNDIETMFGKVALTNYIYEWINSYMKTVFLSSALYTPPIYESFYLPIKVFNNIADHGYTYDSMSWAFNSDRIHQHLSDAFPWIDWQVEFELDYLTDYPEINNYLVTHTHNNGQYNFINLEDIIELFDEYNDVFYPPSSEYTQLPSYVLVLNDTYIQDGDYRIGGFAVGPYQIISRLPYLFFEDSDVNKPIMGLTNVILHEVGHNLGIVHPHDNLNGYGSMFVDDVESYLHCSDQYSVFSIDTVARFHFDYYYMTAQENIANIGYNPISISKVLNLLNQSREAYLTMDYISAVNLAKDAWKLSLTLSNLILRPAVFWSVITCGIIVITLIPTLIFRKNIYRGTKLILSKLKK
ncbi:MAG: hypothetical protein FK733_18090 [Asgard group archaeon]|nr:hypothetical protein [Asgard group archaeon]